MAALPPLSVFGSAAISAAAAPSGASSSSVAPLTFLFPPALHNKPVQPAQPPTRAQLPIALDCFLVGSPKCTSGKEEKQVGASVQKLSVEFQYHPDAAEENSTGQESAFQDARKGFISTINEALQQAAVKCAASHGSLSTSAAASSPALSSSSSSSSSSIAADLSSLLSAYRFYYRDDEEDWLQLTNDSECMAFVLFAVRFHSNQKDAPQKQPILCVVNRSADEELTTKTLREIILANSSNPAAIEIPEKKAESPSASELDGSGRLVAASQFSILSLLQTKGISAKLSTSSSSPIEISSSSFLLCTSRSLTVENVSCIAFPENCVLLLSVSAKDSKQPLLMAAYSFPRLEVGEFFTAMVNVDTANLLLQLDKYRGFGDAKRSEYTLNAQLGALVPAATTDAYASSNDAYLSFTFGCAKQWPIHVVLFDEPLPVIAPPMPHVQRERVPVDAAFRPSNGVEVLVDKEGTVYDAFMTFSEMDPERAAMKYPFCKLQLLQSKLNGCFSLWTRAGRLTSTGNVECFHFGDDQPRAKAAFEKKFFEHTGNSWQNRLNFVQQNGKFAYVEMEGTKWEEINLQSVPLIPAPAPPAPAAKLTASASSSSSSHMADEGSVRYISELNQLRQMGFSDEKLCLFLVNKFRGDINAVVDWLMKNSAGNSKTQVININEW